MNSCLIDHTDFNPTILHAATRIIFLVCIANLASYLLKICDRFPYDLGETVTDIFLPIFLSVRVTIILDFWNYSCFYALFLCSLCCKHIISPFIQMINFKSFFKTCLITSSKKPFQISQSDINATCI